MAVQQLGQIPIGSIIKIKEEGLLTDFLVLQHGYPSASNLNTIVVRNEIKKKGAIAQYSSMTFNYDGSLIDKWILETYFPTIDQELADQISAVNIPVGGATLPRKCFLLSATEVVGKNTTTETDGTQLQWFKDGNPRWANFNGKASLYWTRSRNSDDYTMCAPIDTSGDIGFTTSGTQSYGYRPALILPQSLSVGEDGSVFVNQLPTTPISISVPDTIVSGNPVYITWAQSSDPEGGAVSYELERADDDGSFVQIYAGANPIFTDEGVAAGVSSVQYRVRAKDNKNAYSAYCTSDKRSVVHNSNPTISGEDTDLGSLTEPPSFEFTVNDADSQDSLIITEYIDDIAVKRIEDAEREKPYVFSLSKAQFYGLGNGQHTMKIVVADSLGGTAERIITFSRSISGIEYICGPFETDVPAEKILLSLSYIADVSNFSVYVCNNGFDDVPSWEEAGLVIKHIFSNQSKTAEKWGVAVKVVISKSGDAGQISSGPISGSYI